MKRRGLFRLALIAALLVIVCLALFTTVFGRQLIPGLPLIRLQRVERFAASSITLDSVRELYDFATVRYVHRAVFPYDYLPAGVSINEVLRKLRATTELTTNTLTDDEALFWRTWRLADEIDLSTSGGTFDFVVVTLVLTAGFDLSSGNEEIVVENVTLEDGSIGRSATVRLAPATVIDTAVEDIDRNDYPYPDTSLGAEGWRKVADFVREQSVPGDVLDEVFETARENGERFIRAVLLQAGFAEVRFEHDH